MTRFNRTILLVGVLCVLMALPALAADPTVTKRVLSTDDGSSVVVLRVSASDKAVYGITVSDASASVDDIVAPDGWVGIATDDMIMFRTVDKPISSGKSLSFRIVTKNSQATLGVTFRDKRNNFGSKKDV
jgi:hypothetical protein